MVAQPRQRARRPRRRQQLRQHHYTEGTLDGFEHPTCFDLDGQGNHIEIGNDLPNTNPVGPDE
jgi:hypothetical protein